ncbi:MAG: hypothetical protein AAF639_17510 [Chloroflexota bacterium]
MMTECRVSDIVALQHLIFSYFRTLNVVELKGPEDELTEIKFDLIMQVNQNEIWTKLMEAMNVKTKILPETWGYIDDFFREIPETFNHIPVVQQTIEEAHEEGGLRRQRRLMIRSLNRKFSDSNEELLETLIEHIEQNDDLETLDEWYDQIQDARFLRDLNF